MKFDFGDLGQPGSNDGPPVGDEPEPLFDDPVIAELNKKIIEIMAGIDEAKPVIEELTAEEIAVQQEKEAFLVEVQKKLSKFDSRVRTAQQQRTKIERQIADAEELRLKLEADISHRLEAMEAFTALEAAREQWQRIIDENNWLWSEKAREYQHVGIQYVASGVDRDLFGVGLLDDMGLGKTLQAVGACNLIRNHERFDEMMAERLANWTEGAASNSSILWLCPDSIKDSTVKELAKWTDVPAIVVSGEKAMRNHLVNYAHTAGAIIVVGYAQMRNYLEQPVTASLFEHDWPIVVMDEVHRAKNRESSTFVNLEKLVERAGFIIPMTGTPVDNKAAEFWTILHFLTMKGKRAGEFDSFARFERTYLTSWDQKFQYGQFDQLMETVADMVIRRTKKEVLQDLPDKVRSLRLVQNTGKQAELYRQMREQMFVYLDSDKTDYISARSNILAQLTRLRQINLYPAGVRMQMPDGTEKTLDCQESAKIDDAMTLIEEMMANDQKVLIFSSFKEPLYRIQELIKEKGYTWTDKNGDVRPVESRAMTGDNAKTRSLSQDEFNDPDSNVRVVVGTIRAMGLGLNMQEACSQCIFLDLEWNPGTNVQAEDRLHRQGQKNNVTIHIIHAEDTVDAFIATILDDKQGVIDHMLDRDSLRKALEDGLI